MNKSNELEGKAGRRDTFGEIWRYKTSEDEPKLLINKG